SETNDTNVLFKLDKTLKSHKSSSVKSTTFEKTVKLLLEGLSITEIATAQDIKVETVLNHFARAKEVYNELDFSRFYTTDEKNLVLEAVSIVGKTFLRPIKDHLPESFTYEKIKLILLDI
ncbi:MAG: helix-turn-helix domain-containing protein, partial [Cetobacterium sp.]